MSKLQFVCQEDLEQLISQDRIKLDGVWVSIGELNASYHLTPAVKILSCESDPNDPLQLNNKYIPLSTLIKAGADIYINSITVQHHSYLVDQGYICIKDGSSVPGEHHL